MVKWKPKPPSKMTRERLRELVEYNPETGVMVRRQDGGRGAKAGTVVGFDVGHGMAARIDGVRTLVHRFAWLYMTGAWPDVIDHINRDQYDNRWSNLRSCTQAENRKNNSIYCHNTSGVTGVRKGRRGKWRAEIARDGQQRYIGEFASFDDAVSARKAAEIRLWGEFAPKGV